MVGFKVGSRLALLAGGGLVATGLLTSCAPAAAGAFVLGSVISYPAAGGTPANSAFSLAYTCDPGTSVTFSVNLVGLLPAGKTTPRESTKTPVAGSCTGDQETVDVATFDLTGAGGVAGGGTGITQGLVTITEYDNGVAHHYWPETVDVAVQAAT